MRYIRMMVFVLSFAGFCNAYAGIYEPQEKLKNIAKEFLTQNIALNPEETLEIKIKQSDIPIEVALCSMPIEASFPQDTVRENVTSVKLTCAQPDWHVFIPVALAITTKVLIVKRTIASNEEITEADLDYSQHDIRKLYSGYYKEKSEIVGRVAIHSISAGTVINKRLIRNPILVHRNQEIEVLAKLKTIQVRLKGIAKSDGALSDRIAVVNPATKKTLEAVVTGINQVEVTVSS
ncbi:MAG: flagellar basal body P-ring formation chaperone FlgA [Gammaproteobacteria bacterium]